MQGTPHRLFIEWAPVVDDVRRRREVVSAMIVSVWVMLLVAGAPAVPANPERSPALLGNGSATARARVMITVARARP